MDTQLERKVDMIRNMVESYLNIVHKTQRDYVPKTIMHMIVNEVRVQMTGCQLAEIWRLRVRGRAESRRPGAHISFFTCSLMKSAGPTIWNSLPLSVKGVLQYPVSFKKQLEDTIVCFSLPLKDRQLSSMAASDSKISIYVFIWLSLILCVH